MTGPGAAIGPIEVARTWIRRPETEVTDAGAGAVTREQVHASTVAAPAGGGLVAAWFRGPHEGAPGTRIEWSACPDPDSRIWSVPVAMQPEPGVACWNPVLGHSPQGELCLFFRVGDRISRWRSYRCVWSGSGFSAPAVVSDPGDGGPVKNPPVVLPDGRWLAGGSTEDWSDPPRWDAHVDSSMDGGHRWVRCAIPLDHGRTSGAGVIQPTLWCTPAGEVVALLRSTAGAVYRTVSPDGGCRWSPATPIPVPNNNSGICAAALPDGRVVLAHNPVDDPWGRRCPLVLSVSSDDGRSFSRLAVLEDGATPLEGATPAEHAVGIEGYRPRDSGVVTTGAGEYSYPTVVVEPAADGRTAVLVSYTWQRRGIALAALTV